MLVWMHAVGGLAERAGGGDKKEGNRSPSTSALNLHHTDTCSQWDHTCRHIKTEQHPSGKGPPPRGTLIRKEKVEEVQHKQEQMTSSGVQANRTESQGYQRSPSQWQPSRTSSPLVMCVSTWRMDMPLVTIGHVCTCAWRIDSL